MVAPGREISWRDHGGVRTLALLLLLAAIGLIAAGVIVRLRHGVPASAEDLFIAGNAALLAFIFLRWREKPEGRRWEREPPRFPR